MRHRKGSPQPTLFSVEPEPAAPRAADAKSDALFADVALDLPLANDLTYRVPPGMAALLGARVEVPFRNRRAIGIVTKLGSTSSVDPARVRPIARVLDVEAAIPTDLLALSERLAHHYACGRGEALAAMLPAPLRKTTERRLETVVVLARGAAAPPMDPRPEGDRAARSTPEQQRVLRVLEEAGGELPIRELRRATKCSESPIATLERRGLVRFERRPLPDDVLLRATPSAASPAAPPELTAEQQAAVDAIVAAGTARRFEAFLLYGVTGSGKTEVYLRALERTLAAGRAGIVLVPEISLTPQTVERFRSRFGQVAVLHSHLSDRDRAEQWRALRDGRVRVVVGARSAIFAPVADLGLVVVDEEHEPSFKQASIPRYHAREVALVRGQLAHAAVVLGSATPSLETWKRAQSGAIHELRLTQRVAGGALPPVHIADLRLEAARELHLGAGVPITRPLKQAVDRALERKERVILFLNRRGFAPVLWCRACGKTLRCPRCAVSLNYHRRIRRLVCHQCGHEEEPVRVCPSCGAPGLRPLGAGTERIEETVLKIFPKAHVARMDSDTTLQRGSHERILDRFRSGEVDVLVGTQMIAKGLDVPEVTVVGVVDADSTLHVPEYHAAERTFQLVAQVAGRAGRSHAPGEVIVQTSLPDHPAIACAAKHDFEKFAKGELREREEFRYPPFVRLVRVLVEGKPEPKVRAAIEDAARMLRDARARGVEILGPRPAPLDHLRGKWRWHLLLRCDPPDRVKALRPLLLDLATRALPGGLRAAVDVDPISTL